MSANNDEKYRVWDSLWQDNRLLSVGVEKNPDIAANFEAHWKSTVDALEPGARVLDLACGNGHVALTVAQAAQDAGKKITIDAIDAAAIDPKRYLISHKKLVGAVNFHGRTLMEELPFEPDTFDAVFSQFGIEYGNLSKSCSEVGRVLKPSGGVSILALASSSSLTEQIAGTAKQIRQILTGTKLFDIALAVAQALHVSETSGQGRDPTQYLQKFSAEVERVMAGVSETNIGPVAAVISTLQDVLTRRKTMKIADQLAVIEKLKTRLTEYASRNETTTKAALGDASLDALVRGLSSAGVKGLRPEPRAVGALGTVAWTVST